MLIDCGHTTVSSLIKCGINLHDIDAVFISHFHTDHFNDLLPLVHARFVDDKRKGRKHKKLIIFGPKTLPQRWQTLRKIMWPEPKEHYPLQFITGARTQHFHDLNLNIFKVRHVEWFPSLGIKITGQGKTLIYTGDIGSSHSFQKLKQTVSGANLLIIEGGVLKPQPNHYSVQQIIELTQTADIKKPSSLMSGKTMWK